MTLKPVEDLELANWSSLSGYVNALYDDLVKAFGEPHPEGGDGYKVDVEWVLRSDDGHVVTVYNYKNGKNYEGEDGLEVEDMDYWCVGGFRQEEDVELVAQAMGF